MRAATLKRLLDAARRRARGADRRAGRPGRLRPHRARRRRQRGDASSSSKDASPAERAIREINAGFYALERAPAVGAGWRSSTTATRRRSTTSPTWSRWRSPTACRSRAVKADDAWEAAGVNTQARARRAGARSISAARGAGCSNAGVTLADPARIDVRGALECGRDVAIDVNCVFEGRVSARRRRAHRPQLRAAQRLDRRRHRGARRSPPRGLRGRRALPRSALTRACGPAPRSPRRCTSATSSR